MYEVIGAMAGEDETLTRPGRAVRTDGVKCQPIHQEDATTRHRHRQLLPHEVEELWILVGPCAASPVRLGSVVRQLMRPWHDQRRPVLSRRSLEIDEHVQDRSAPLLNVTMQPRRLVDRTFEIRLVMAKPRHLDVWAEHRLKCRLNDVPAERVQEHGISVKDAVDAAHLAVRVDTERRRRIGEQIVNNRFERRKDRLRESVWKPDIAGTNKEGAQLLRAFHGFASKLSHIATS